MQTKPPMDEKSAAPYLAMINDKLDRIRNGLIQQIVPLTLTESMAAQALALQWAVRKIEAAKRDVRRGFEATYSPTPEVKRRARLEQQLSRPDRGDIFKWMDRNHSIGLFACKACAFDTTEAQNPLGPVRVPLARLCPSCEMGVQHAGRILAEAEDAVSEAFMDFSGSEAPLRRPSPHGANKCDVGGVYVMFLCDSCGAQNFQVDR